MLYFIVFFIMFLSSCSNDVHPRNTPVPDKTYQTTVPQQATPVTPQPSPLQTPKPTESPVPVAESKVISSFKTPLLDKDPERIENIKLAAKSVDGCVVKKGKEFSFNRVVGERSEERGYKVATVLVGEEHREDFGGGVCQIATSIYNAAKAAGLNITEHHTHKVEIAYAPGGTDATVNYDNLDFKFRNNSEYDIKIVISVEEEFVSAEVQKK